MRVREFSFHSVSQSLDLDILIILINASLSLRFVSYSSLNCLIRDNCCRSESLWLTDSMYWSCAESSLDFQLLFKLISLSILEMHSLNKKWRKKYKFLIEIQRKKVFDMKYQLIYRISTPLLQHKKGMLNRNSLFFFT